MKEKQIKKKEIKRLRERRDIRRYRVFINYCVFPYNFGIFLNSASSAAALVLYLPGVCTHTDTERNRERPESGIYFKIFEITQYLMNTLYMD